MFRKNKVMIDLESLNEARLEIIWIMLKSWNIAKPWEIYMAYGFLRDPGCSAKIRADPGACVGPLANCSWRLKHQSRGDPRSPVCQVYATITIMKKISSESRIGPGPPLARLISCFSFVGGDIEGTCVYLIIADVGRRYIIKKLGTYRLFCTSRLLMRDTAHEIYMLSHINLRLGTYRDASAPHNNHKDMILQS